MKFTKTLICLFCICLTFATLRAAGPEFEVATVRPAPEITIELARSGKLHLGMNIDHSRVDIGGLNLSAILQAAFTLGDGQIAGPDWMKSARFDILAKMPDDATEDQVPQMLQALLADRFKLTVHRETREQSVYVLVVAKGGIKATEVPADAEVPSLLSSNEKSDAPLRNEVAPMGGQLIHVTETSDGGGVISGPKIPPIRFAESGKGIYLESSKISCAELATLLAGMVNQPVVDLTEARATTSFPSTSLLKIWPPIYKPTALEQSVVKLLRRGQQIPRARRNRWDLRNSAYVWIPVKFPSKYS